MEEYRRANLLKFAMLELKANVALRRHKKTDPILRQVLAMEDKGDDGEFFSVKILNTDEEIIKGGPLKHFIDVTDRQYEDCNESKRTEKVKYTHQKINLQYRQMITV
jgi:hypothetical protein